MRQATQCMKCAEAPGASFGAVRQARRVLICSSCGAPIRIGSRFVTVPVWLDEPVRTGALPQRRKTG